MKKYSVLALALLSPAVCAAQSIPPMDRRVTLQGPTGLNWALSTKADTKNGQLNAPIITGGNAVGLELTGSILDSSSQLNGSDISAGSVTAAGGTTALTASQMFSAVIDVRTRGVKCDGSTDDAAAINALSATAVSNTKFVFPQGTCVFASPLAFNLINGSVAGAGMLSTRFLYTGTSTTGDLITFGPGNFADTITGFNVQSATKMTSGAAIHAQKMRYSEFDGVSATLYYETPDGTTENNLWNGIWIDQPDLIFLNRGRIEAQNDGFQASALGVGTGYQYDIFMQFFKIDASTNGVHVGGGIDNVHFDNMEVTSNTNDNVLIDHTIEAFKNQEVFFGKNFVTDHGGNWNYYIDDSLANTTNYGIIAISGPITAAKTYDNIYVKNWPASEIVIDSPFISSAARDNVRVADESVILSFSPATVVTAAVEYGMNSEFGNFNKIKSDPNVFGNATDWASTVVRASVSAPSIMRTTASALPMCTLSTQVGAQIYVTDGRKPNEAAGAGSGIIAYCSATASGATTYQWVSALSGEAVTN